MSTIELTIQDVRVYLQDDPDSNHLLRDEEFTDKRIEQALDLSIQSFNEIPPVLTGFTRTNLPVYLKDVILTGILAKLYRGAALQQERNRLSYSDGGIQVASSDKGQFYMSVAQQFQADFEARASRWKQWVNVNEGFGSISSDYAQINV